MTREEALQRAIDILGEHYDSVQVSVSFNEAGGTMLRHRGCGNWYARQGMAHDFITSDQAKDLAIEIGNVINPEDE